MKCTGENRESCVYVLEWNGYGGKQEKGLSAAKEPTKGRITSRMGRSAKTVRNLCGLSCLHMEKSPILPRGGPSLQSLYPVILQQQPTGPWPNEKAMSQSTVSIQVQVTLGILFSRRCLLPLSPLIKHQQLSPEILEQRLLPGGDRWTLEWLMLQPTWVAKRT